MATVPTRIRLIRVQLTRFLRAVDGIERGDVRSLHRARVATRRLREIVPLLQLDRDAMRKLNRRLRAVTSRLGSVREHDVLLEVIDEFNAARRVSADALARVGMAVARDRDAARARALERLPLDDMRRLARKLRSAAESAVSDSSRHTRTARSGIEMRLARRATRLAEALRDAGAVYLPERLHSARISIKKLRYVLEVAGQVSDAQVKDDVALLRRAQDTLGRMHDLQVLIDRVRGVQATLAPPSVTVWRALDSLVHVLDDDCRRLHARYMKLRPGLESLAGRLSGSGDPEGSGVRVRRRAAG